MATAPLAQMMARKLIGQIGGQAPSPMAPDQGSQAGPQVAQQLSELQGADPESMMKALSQVKSIVVSLFPKAAFSLPGVSRHLAQVIKYLDNAIGEAEKGAATAQAVGPIANNAAIPNPQAPSSGMGLQDFASGGGA